MAISLKVNGTTRSVDAEPDTPLLYVLRNDFERDLPLTPERVRAVLA